MTQEIRHCYTKRAIEPITQNTLSLIMHLSMLGRRGGRRGKGAGFDEKVYPVSGEFDDQYSPGGRGIWQILKIVVILHI
jgi:hypothetical protein